MISDELLTLEVEDLIRSAPEIGTLTHYDPQILEWRGRLSAVFTNVDSTISHKLQMELISLDSRSGDRSWSAETNIISLLHEARHKLRLRSPTATSLLVNTGAVFEYFDEVRKIITTATKEIFFIDPYADPEFVSKYLSQIASPISIRILMKAFTPQNVPALLASVDTFAKQHGHSIEVRSSNTIHDRYVFVDRAECYHSGASFKDGAKKAPAGITQILDAFPAMLSTYEGIWTSAKIER